jgi:hypothetical protein
MRPAIVTKWWTSVKNFQLEYPRTQKFDKRRTRIFTAILVVVSATLMLLTAAAQTYEPLSVYSRAFNGTTSLWYERFLRSGASGLGLPESWSCSGSIIQLGDGALPVCCGLIKRYRDDKRLPQIHTEFLYRQQDICS